MYYYETDSDTYAKIREQLPEVWEGIEISLLVSDENLQRLGFSERIPCVISIDITADEREKLMDKLMDCEIDAFTINKGGYDETSP